MLRERREFFADHAGKGSLLSSKEATRGSSGCGRDSRASSRVETGMLGNFLSCSKGVKELWKFQSLGVISLETPERKWASSRLNGRTSWIFSSCGRCSRLTTGTSGTRSGGLRKGQSPWELLGGLSGVSRDSSPVETGMSGNFLSCSKRVKDPLEVPEVRCE